MTGHGSILSKEIGWGSVVARVNTVAFAGIEARPVDVQVQLSAGLPAFTIVGLPDKAVGESRERVRAALISIGLALPPKRITVNLSPADQPKEGSHYDLAIALGLMVAMGVLPGDEISEYIVFAELALDGRLAAVGGALPAAMHAAARGLGVICARASGPEAAWAGEVGVLAPDSLLALVNHFKGSQVLSAPVPMLEDADTAPPCLSDVRGQQTARRALEIAAAGGHNLLMTGPPGSGKSMLAARLPGILPPLTPREALEVSMIASIAGTLADGRLRCHRPFRAPHHSTSVAALVGGGQKARPGEVSLAHAGVLFLDELPEFSRPALEALRQPMESGETLIARANAHITYPACFQLVAAMNPCRCGHLDDPGLACARAPKCAQDYQNRISGPIYDRMDLCVSVPTLPPAELMEEGGDGEDSATVARRVAAARAMQDERGAGINARLDGEALKRHAALDSKSKALLLQAMEKFRLSARGYTRVLRVARSIADLAGSTAIGREHVAEALHYRRPTPK